MEADNSQDLPAEILEKLRNLELELEDGDITLKGFEKKKASLLADISSNPSSPISPHQQKSEAELLDELGPEPSAADVVDFLDFLPSPTHSPTRTVEAVNLMEENHRQIQQQQQQHQQQPQQHHQQYQQLPQQQQQYQPLPQQQQQIRPMQPQYRPYPGNNGGMGRGPYYNNTPVPNNRPYMVRNNGYPQQPSPQQPQMRPMPPPGANPYYGQRPPPPPQNIGYRPQQQPPRPQQQQQPTTSPRLMYRPQPRPNGGYRPQPQYAPVGQPQYGNYGYNNAGSVNRSLSTNSGTSNMVQQQRPSYNSMYTPRSDSMEWNQ